MIRKLLRRLRERYAALPFHPMDYVVLSYIALIGLLLIPFHRNVDHWIQYPILHLFAIILIFTCIFKESFVG